MKKVIKNNKNEIIAVVLHKFRVEASYCVGYGANLRRLKGIKKKVFYIVTNSHARACDLIAEKSGLAQGLNAGYMFKAVRVKY